jgi:hypothetical protein
MNTLPKGQSECKWLERATRIELAFSAWEADVLPLNYARGTLDLNSASLVEFCGVAVAVALVPWFIDGQCQNAVRLHEILIFDC